MRTPDQELAIAFDNTEIFSHVTHSKMSFGYTAGAGVRYSLNSNIALRLGVDFFQTRAQFNYTFDLFRGVAEDVPPIEADFLVRTLELSAGLAYSF